MLTPSLIRAILALRNGKRPQNGENRMAHTEYRIYYATAEGERPYAATISMVRNAIRAYYPDTRNRKAAMDLLVNHGLSMNTPSLQIWSVTVAD
jgi:hypothetical protein